MYPCRRLNYYMQEKKNLYVDFAMFTNHMWHGVPYSFMQVSKHVQPPLLCALALNDFVLTSTAGFFLLGKVPNQLFYSFS